MKNGAMFGRRAVVGALVLGLTWMSTAGAEEGAKVFRVAYLGNSSPSLEADLLAAFRAGLRELGYVEGQNLVIDFRWAEGNYDRLPAFAAEAVRLNADVIVTAGTPGALAAKRATTTIPIVMAVIADPVSVGVVSSLARPGGNITGSATMLHELAGKRLDLLRTLVPGVSRVAVIWNPTNPANARLIRELQAAAARARVALDPLVGGGSDRELGRGFAAIGAALPDALVVEPDRALLAHRAAIVGFAARQKLPTVYPYQEYVEIGGLVSYAPSFSAMFRRAAAFVDKVLKGAKAGDLPVEQPTTFELAVNLKTAKALGITVPPALLLQADRVID